MEAGRTVPAGGAGIVVAEGISRVASCAAGSSWVAEWSWTVERCG